MDDIERRVLKLEQEVSNMRENYAPLMRVIEMVKPIETAMTEMKGSMSRLSERVESVFDMYEGFLRDRAAQEKAIAQEKIDQAQRVANERIEQERRIADEKIRALETRSVANRVKEIAQVVGLVVGLITIIGAMYAFLKYIILPH